MAAAAWVRMLYFARFELSNAISTSSILPTAARIFAVYEAIESAAKFNLDIEPPAWARKYAIFSNAVSKLLIDISDNCKTSAVSSAANEIVAASVTPVTVELACVENFALACVAVFIVRAASKEDLKILILVPVDPLSLVKILRAFVAVVDLNSTSLPATAE